MWSNGLFVKSAIILPSCKWSGYRASLPMAITPRNDSISLLLNVTTSVTWRQTLLCFAKGMEIEVCDKRRDTIHNFKRHRDSWCWSWWECFMFHTCGRKLLSGRAQGQQLLTCWQFDLSEELFAAAFCPTLPKEWLEMIVAQSALLTAWSSWDTLGATRFWHHYPKVLAWAVLEPLGESTDSTVEAEGSDSEAVVTDWAAVSTPLEKEQNLLGCFSGTLSVTAAAVFSHWAGWLAVKLPPHCVLCKSVLASSKEELFISLLKQVYQHCPPWTVFFLMWKETSGMSTAVSIRDHVNSCMVCVVPGVNT